MNVFRLYRFILILCAVCASLPILAAPAIDLSSATVVVRGDKAPLVEQTAATVLVEEVEKRTGIRWTISTAWPKEGVAIAVVSGKAKKLHGKSVPAQGSPEAEGFTLHTGEGKTLWVVGADAKGALNGVGKLLRTLNWRPGAVGLDAPLNLSSAPDLPIRGHQLGYRTTANSYDAWSIAQYDQYIRELALFGVNAVENIPFQDDESPHMTVTREAMNRALGTICQKYGVVYWVWTPATVDLTNADARASLLAQHEAFYKDCTHLDAVFFPGGDPGDNHPKDVMPFLEDVAALLAKYHPGAKVWMSPQGFDPEGVDYFFNWLTEHQPTWFGGAVGGPSSPPLPEMRARLPKQYPLRDYPDITHSVRAQYPVPWLDPAFALTSGREGTNPGPVYYSTIFRAFAAYTDGFISYSDGMHDDVNKVVFSALGWDVDGDVRKALIEYCRLFFSPDVAERAADGIYALERNWEGPLAQNGAVEATLTLWQDLDAAAPQLRGNWRWQLCLLKANYDAYQRARLIHETALENEANAVLLQAGAKGANAVMDDALGILQQADTNNPRPDLRARIEELCADLFKSIGYQSSVEKYQANNAQRSAVLDFVDHPLNNRWWYEDQFTAIRGLTEEAEKTARLRTIATWENPGPGSFYDDIGNVSKSPHVIHGETLGTDPLMVRNPNPDFMWWDNGKCRLRQSWISKMDWPMGLRYDGLDPEATYVLRTTGLAQCLPRVNGELIAPTVDGKEIGEIKEFPIPQMLYKSGTIELKFDVPYEPGINWRKASRLTEVWLIKE